MITIIVGVVAVVGAIAALASGGGDDRRASPVYSSPAVVTTLSPAGGTGSAGSSGGASGSGSSSNSGGTTGTSSGSTGPAAASQSRSAQITTDYGTLRSEPRLAPETEIAIIQNRSGSTLQILGANANGWYRIRLDNLEGWLFGAFVTPNDAGLFAAISNDRQPAVLRNASGTPLGIENPSGNKVLVVSSSGSQWEVLLPDGNRAYVSSAEFHSLG